MIGFQLHKALKLCPKKTQLGMVLSGAHGITNAISCANIYIYIPHTNHTNHTNHSISYEKPSFHSKFSFGCLNLWDQQIWFVESTKIEHICRFFFLPKYLWR